jgi:hypothetical protein
MGQLKNRSPMTNRNIQISLFIGGYSNIINDRLPYRRCVPERLGLFLGGLDGLRQCRYSYREPRRLKFAGIAAALTDTAKPEHPQNTNPFKLRSNQ